MKKTRKALALILAAIMILALLTACKSGEKEEAKDPTANTTTGTAEKVLTVGTTYSQLYFYSSGSGESDNYCRRLLYDQLFYVDDYTGEISSDVLASYEWETDTVLKLVLKDNVTFSDGSKMTGEDILATVKSYVDNGNSEIEFYKRIDFDKSAVDADGLTTRIVYSEVYGAAISTLMIPVLPAAAIEQHSDGDDYWWTSAIGSGPYELSKVELGSYVEYTRRDDYWNKDASYEADKIVVKYYTDATAEYADLLSGELDAMVQLSTTQVDQLSGEKDVKVVTQSANDVAFICFNEATVAPEVREAIAYAVDWEQVAIAGYGSLQVPATSHYATTFDAYTDHGTVYEYDVDKAKEILASAGISNLTLSIPCFSGAASDIAIAETLQFYLEQVGIKLTVDQMDIPTLIPTLISGGGDLCIQSTIANGNAAKEVNTAISPMLSDGFAIMAIADDTWNDLVRGGIATTDAKKRVEIYKEADQWLYDNYHGVPICEREEAFAYNSAKLADMSLANTQRGNLACVKFN